jgi:hypothetical protein
MASSRKRRQQETMEHDARTREILTVVTAARVLTIIWEIVNEYVLHGAGPGRLL